MGLSINDAEVERMVRELAARRGVPTTEAEARSAAGEADRRARHEAAIGIAARVAAMPDISDMTDDEILGYDEKRIPSPSGDFALTDVKVARW